MGDLKAPQKGKGRQAGIYGEEDFVYDADTDTYRCPAGEVLTLRHHMKHRNAYEYSANAKVCMACSLRSQCTRSKSGRTIKRHENHEAIQAARAQSHSAEAKRNRRKRKWFMERSFADAANNHGFKRSRWRRLKNQQVQDFLIAAIQNTRILLGSLGRRPRAVAMQAVCENTVLRNTVSSLMGLFLRRSHPFLCFVE